MFWLNLAWLMQINTSYKDYRGVNISTLLILNSHPILCGWYDIKKEFKNEWHKKWKWVANKTMQKIYF